MYPVVKRAKTRPTIPTTQVYALLRPKSPCGDTARLPSMRRVSVLPIPGLCRLPDPAELQLDEAQSGGCDHRLQLGVHLQLLDHVADVPLHGVGGDAHPF